MKHVGNITCASPGCTKTISSRLMCPKCIKLGLPASYFCNQSCFRMNYKSHSLIHREHKKNRKNHTTSLYKSSDGISCYPKEDKNICLSLPNWAINFRFTGDLRPTLLSPKRTIPLSVRRPDYADHVSGQSISETLDRANNNYIRVYSSKELDGDEKNNYHGIRHACSMGREVLDIGGLMLRVGVTTDEIDRVIHEACIERNVYPSPLNYYLFPKSVCTSVNEVICHGIPDYRELQDGDIVNLDVTTFNDGGYHGDLNETFCVGKNVTSEAKKLVHTAYTCLQEAVAIVKPGTLYRDLGNIIHKHATNNRCSVVRTYCGHGIGSLFHTAPNVPHYKKNKAKGIMKVGHVFTIEPMINIGTHHDIKWDDDWSAVTADGSLSAQFEHTLLVTKGGYEILTARESEPIMCWNEKLVQRYT